MFDIETYEFNYNAMQCLYSLDNSQSVIILSVVYQ